MKFQNENMNDIMICNSDALQMVEWVGFKSEAEKAHQLFFSVQGTSTTPGQFTFRAEEMVRLKFPILASPAPHVQVLISTIAPNIKYLIF